MAHHESFIQTLRLELLAPQPIEHRLEAIEKTAPLELHSQPLQYAGGGKVRSIGCCFDFRQAERQEGVSQQGAGCFSRQSLCPVAWPDPV
jgi:hypothetical protein